MTPEEYAAIKDTSEFYAKALRNQDATPETARPGFYHEWQPNNGTDDQDGRYKIYRLCVCFDCSGRGKTPKPKFPCSGCNGLKSALCGDCEAVVMEWRRRKGRCQNCRGEGRTRQLIATALTPAGVGQAIVTLGQEGEFEDCPLGLLDQEGEKDHKWLIRPWGASPRNVTDAAKLMRATQLKGETK